MAGAVCVHSRGAEKPRACSILLLGAQGLGCTRLGGAEQLARGAVPGTVSEGQLAHWQGARAELMVIKNPALLALSPPADQEGKLIFFAISFTTG